MAFFRFFFSEFGFLRSCLFAVSRRFSAFFFRLERFAVCAVLSLFEATAQTCILRFRQFLFFPCRKKKGRAL